MPWRQRRWGQGWVGITVQWGRAEGAWVAPAGWQYGAIQARQAGCAVSKEGCHPLPPIPALSVSCCHCCCTQMRDLPQGPPSPSKAIQAALGEQESSGAEPAPANPFSAGARSKL